MLVLSLTRRAIFRVFAMSHKIPTKPQHILKTGPKIHPKTTKTPLTNPSKNASDLGAFFTSKMEQQLSPNGMGKIGEISLWAPWAAKGGPKDPQSHPLDPKNTQNGAQSTPRPPKMDPKRPPGRPKRCPSEPRAPKMEPKLPPRIHNGAQVSKLFKRNAHA